MGLFNKGRLIALTLFLSLFFSSLYAQDAYISGTITDKATGETLIGANVVIQGTTMGVSTDLDGGYVLTGVTPGDYTLWITYIGYEEVLIPISLKAGDKKVIDASLGYGGAVGLDEVVVTAQAKGQMSAINQQLNSKSIANVVSAEKMQELPDANAAETLGRLPGVSVARTGGEGNKVVVRGLSPKYNRVTMEGVNMAAAGDDRSTDISSISPYSLGGITVYKAATADKNAEFIGGMVEFKLREAREGWNSDVVAQMGYNELKGTFSDYLVNASISNRFLDNKLGVFVQANAEQRNRSSNEMNATYRMLKPEVDLDGNKVITTSASLSDVFRSKKRMGATAVLDYRLDGGSIKFKNFYSGSDTQIQKYGEKIASDPIQSNTYTYSGQDVKYLAQSYSNILSFDKRFNKIKIEGKVSHSYSKSESPYQVDAYYRQNDAFNGVDDIDLSAENTPFLVLDKVHKVDSLSFLQNMKKSSSISEDRQLGASFDLTYDYKITDNVNGFLKIGTDYRHTTRSKDLTAWGSDLTDPRNTQQLWDHYHPDEMVINKLYPFSRANDTGFDHRTFMDGRYQMGSVIDMNTMNSMMDLLMSNGSNSDQYPYDKSSKQHDYNGTEDYFATYILTEINLGSKVKFIPGMRYESNNTSYTGVYGNTQAIQEQTYPSVDTTTTRDNWYLLPMIHLKYKPSEWFDVRVAYTHTLSRPSFYQIAPRFDYFVESKIVSYNNFNLVPEYSVNWDIYFTFHSNKLGLFSIGGFTKKIDNMIFNTGKRVILSDTDYDLPTGNHGNVEFPDTYLQQTIYTTVNSTEQASLYGVEVDWQSNFYFLPGAWKGLVMNINYTHIYSEVNYPSAATVEQVKLPSGVNGSIQTNSYYQGSLIDQPEDIINVGLGYDYKGFSARVSMFYQATVFKRADQFVELSTYNEDYLRWDFTAKQKLPWAGLELFTNINNITNAKDVTVVRGTGYDSNISGYGMTVDLGVRWKM